MVDARGEKDNLTILDALRRLEELGFTGQFRPLPGANVQCVECGGEAPADGTVLRDLRRLEGASDPDDMVAVVGLECPHCGSRGTIALSYGPEADIVDSEVLASLEDCRRGDC